MVKLGAIEVLTRWPSYTSRKSTEMLVTSWVKSYYKSGLISDLNDIRIKDIQGSAPPRYCRLIVILIFFIITVMILDRRSARIVSSLGAERLFHRPL